MPFPGGTSQPTSPKRPSRDLEIDFRDARITQIPIAGPHLAMPEDFTLLLNFMPLTGLRLGIASFAHLPSGPVRSKDLFSAPHLGSRKLLSFIPSRYGQVSSLSHATDCVVAKLRQIIQPPNCMSARGEAIVLSHYSKALRALQAALDDETQQLTPETLCATELLGVFEVFQALNRSTSHILR
jgi:hypothetical protein